MEIPEPMGMLSSADQSGFRIWGIQYPHWGNLDEIQPTEDGMDSFLLAVNGHRSKPYETLVRRRHAVEKLEFSRSPVPKIRGARCE